VDHGPWSTVYSPADGQKAMNESTASSIALCMIVRDEEEHIAQCIESVRDVVAELVVVDTGSRDRTVEIARSYGARVVYHTWQDDFAAARNAGLDVAQSDWILVLDADEVVAEADHDELRRMVSVEEQVAYRFVSRNYGNDPQLTGWVPCTADDVYSRGFAGWHPSVKVRVFPNGLGIRFVGRVHELVRDSVDRLGIPRRTTDVPIHHYGRGPAGLSERKRVQYLELGRKKVADNPSDPKAHFELGNLLAEIGQTAGAGAEYETALRLTGGSPIILAALGSVRYRQGRYTESVDFYRRSLDTDSDQPETRRNLATALIALGDFQAAHAELRDLVARHGDMHDVFYLEGIVAQRLADVDRAVEMFVTEVHHRPSHRRAAEALAEIAGKAEYCDRIIELGRKLVEEHPSEPHLHNLYGEALHHGGRVDEAVRLFEQTVDADPSDGRAWNNLGVARLAQNRTREALAAFRDALRLDPHNPVLHNNIRLLRKKI